MTTQTELTFAIQRFKLDMLVHNKVGGSLMAFARVRSDDPVEQYVVLWAHDGRHRGALAEYVIHLAYFHEDGRSGLESGDYFLDQRPAMKRYLERAERGY